MQIPCARLDPGLPLPRYARHGDAGVDLFARFEATVQPFERCLMATGLAVAIPTGWVGLVHPRSGLSSAHGVTVVNSPGTIDSGYRGEIKVPLINLDPSMPFVIQRGDRIAQLLVQEVAMIAFDEVDDINHLPASQRGATGFGASGGFGNVDSAERH